MNLLFKGGMVYQSGRFERADVLTDGENIAAVGQLCNTDSSNDGAEVKYIPECVIVPGFADVHVHLREPGFSYKETVASGTASAAAGGYTVICSMPNLNPVPDSPEHLRVQLDIIRKNACVYVIPYGAITRGEHGKELSDFAGMSDSVAGFSDDGHGVQSGEMMRRAMTLAKSLHKPVAAHCEDESLLPSGWAVHDGTFARRMGLTGNPSESEWRQVERDLQLVRETGCQYHVCHVSAKESVSLIRAAKQEGLPVSCETAPHYLTLYDEELSDNGRFRMNPPVRSMEDRDALVSGLLDGTIDCIATDHAPHSLQEKSGVLANSLNGIIGLETAFPVLYTKLVEPGIVPLERLLDALCIRPREIFHLAGGNLKAGEPADFTVLNLHSPYIIDPAKFYSMGRATPFEGWKVSAKVVMTVCGGKVVYTSHNT